MAIQGAMTSQSAVTNQSAMAGQSRALFTVQFLWRTEDSEIVPGLWLFGMSYRLHVTLV